MAKKNAVEFFLRFGKIILLIVLITNLFGCNLPTMGESYSGTGYDVVVVLMKHTLQPMCTTEEDCLPWWPSFARRMYLRDFRHTASEYEDILNTEINKYYQQVTYGQVYFNFHVLSNPNSKGGWWQAPHALWEFNKNLASYDGDGVLLASRAIGADLLNYERLLVIQNIYHFGAANCQGPNDYTPFYPRPCGYNLDNGGYININVSEVSMDTSDENMFHSIVHELGHSLGAPDEYYGNYIGTGGWDMMGNRPDMYAHFGAWTKLDRGWLSWTENTKSLCLTGSCEITTTLDPLEIKGNNALLIPYNSSPAFVGMIAECRKKILGDEKIYEEGVLLTTTNPYYNDSQGTIVEVRSPNSNPYGVLKPGEVYYDSARDIRITNISKPGEQPCTVKAVRNAPNVPDPNIIQGSEQPGGAYSIYGSQDIWIDNAKNYWNWYPASEATVKIPAYSYKYPDMIMNWDIPLGNGDPLWVNYENSIRFMIHNSGIATATDFIVNVYIRKPLAVTIQNSNCGASSEAAISSSEYLPELIGSVTVAHLEPGTSYVGNVIWYPESTAPVEIEVTIEEYPSESDINNNTAYETFATFYHGTLSADHEFSEMGSMQLKLSEECTLGLPFITMPMREPQGLGCNWEFETEPAGGTIQPGQTLNISMSGRPSEESQPGDVCKGSFEVEMPFNDTYASVGGFAFEARTVNKSSITCNAPVQAMPLGLPVSITGNLVPALADTIALEYIAPSGDSTIQNPETDNNGAYTNMFSPTLAGLWTVQSFWQGDGSHEPAESTLCRFTVGEAITPTLAGPSPTPPAPTITPTSPALSFIPNINAYCRSGPDTSFPSTDIAMTGQPYLLDGRNLDNTWYRIMVTTARGCWVPRDVGSPSSDAVHLRVLADVPTLTPTTPFVATNPPTLVPTQVVDCSAFQDEPSCNGQPACTWYQTPSTRGVCANK